MVDVLTVQAVRSSTSVMPSFTHRSIDAWSVDPDVLSKPTLFEMALRNCASVVI